MSKNADQGASRRPPQRQPLSLTHVLRLWTSPRDTIVWAADPAAADAVRSTLASADVPFWPVTIRGAVQDAAVNIDIGVDADQALQVLAAAGYAYTWHHSVEPANRRPHWYSVTVDDG